MAMRLTEIQRKNLMKLKLAAIPVAEVERFGKRAVADFTKLVNAGYARIYTDPEDEDIVCYEITPEGEDVV